MKDPGSTPLGAEIRKLVKDPSLSMLPASQMLLYTAARVEAAELVKWLVQDGKFVVMDRWWPSTYAYQGAFYGVSKELIFSLTRQLMPPEALPGADTSFFLDLMPIRVCMERSGALDPKGIEGGGDRHEAKGMELQATLWSAYDQLVNEGSLTRITFMENVPAEAVAERVLKHLVMNGYVD